MAQSNSIKKILEAIHVALFGVAAAPGASEVALLERVYSCLGSHAKLQKKASREVQLAHVMAAMSLPPVVQVAADRFSAFAPWIW